MSLSLWAPHGNSRNAKILIAAEVAKVTIELMHISYEDTKKPEFLQKHPLGKVPLLETPEGPIYESFAILRYIARKSNSLYGATPFEKAQIENWLNSTLVELDPLTISLLCAITGLEPATKDVYTRVYKAVREWAKSFDAEVKGKNFLVGGQLSIADIAVASYVHHLLRLTFDDKFRPQIPNVVQWYERVTSIPEFSAYLGKTWYTTKEFEPVTFADEENPSAEKKIEKGEKAEKGEKGGDKEKANKPKGEKTEKVDKTEKAEKTQKGEKGEKAEKKPKVEDKKDDKKKDDKKKDKKKKEEDDDASEDEAPVTKAPNPLDLLPKSPFVLDDFKREISNTTDRAATVKAFWDKYDPEGWSLWKTVYDKYEGEGVVGYLTSNLKNGFLRNLDHFRKYAFAGFGVYGPEGKYDIKGVWLWRGTEIPAEIKDHQSYEYYKITKLDHTKEEDRKVLEEYWTNLEEGQLVEGVPVFEAKYFK